MGTGQFASGLSTREPLAAALDDACQQVRDQLAGAPPTLAFAFVTPGFDEPLDGVGAAIRGQLGARHVLGCTAESVAGVRREVEGEAAVALWAAALPDAAVHPLRLEFANTPEGPVITGWPDDLPEPWPPGAALLLLADPFSFPADLLVERLADDHPAAPVLGGMASGAAQPGDNRLWLDDAAHPTGAVAVLLAGGVRVSSVVSQGCRPIGQHFVITKAERNIIHELGGRPPLAQFQDVFDRLAASEQRLATQGLHVGRVVNELQDRFEQGDFLVRNVIGADRHSGAIAIGDYVRPGQTVQFHIRDHATASAELRQLLAAARNAGGRPQGALLFTCNGRGTRLFPEPHHDAATLADVLGDIPLAGFFAQGELGPIGGRNFLHGFTASIALLESI